MRITLSRSSVLSLNLIPLFSDNSRKRLAFNVLFAQSNNFLSSGSKICSYEPEQTLDTTYIIAKLEKSSELTTAKLNFTGISEFKDSGIAFISKSDFIMVYEATARAGIDVKDIKVVADDINHVVWLTLPEAEVLDVKVDMNKIKYFDEKFSLFNVDAKEDANKANALAEEEAKKELASMGILEMANDQAEALIKGLIQDVVPKDYEIKIKK